MDIASQLYQGLFETAYSAIIVINAQGIIEQFNSSAERLFLYTKEEAIGKNVNILMGGAHKEKHQQYIQNYLETHITHNIIGKGREISALRKDGSSINIFISVSEAKVNNQSYFVAIINDIDEVFGMRKALKKLATYDQLTKAYSRSYFDSHLENWLTEFHHNKQPVSFIMLDLNGFKKINDDLGHHVGDKILIEFSKRLQNQINEKDYLVRLGGDEFLIITPKNEKQALELASQLLTVSEQPYLFEGPAIYITPSIGIYNYTQDQDSSRALQKADFALYEAKKRPTFICLFTEDLENKFRQQNKLEKIVRNAFNSPDSFYLVFQPIMDVIKEEIIGFEALLRLNHNSEDIAPETFIRSIESLKYSEQLNDMLVDKLISTLQQYTWPSDKKIKISFNLSPQIYHFKNHLTSLLEKLDTFIKSHPNIFLEIEMTESKLMAIDVKYPGQWLTITQLLKAHQVNLAIDDFGREYSSIYRLLEYRVNTLKIDKFFISQLNNNHSSQAESVLKALFSLGEELGVTIIAEGVETQEQLNSLKTLGCHFAQGYYFSMPISQEEAFKLVGSTLKSID